MFRYVKKLPSRRTTVLMVKRTFAIENDKLKTEKKKESSIAQKLKDTVQRYGVIATMFHSTVYVSSLSTVYLGVSNGVDASALLSSWGLDPTIIPDGAGELAAAWAITAVTGPARAVGTVIGTPIVAGWWRSRTSIDTKTKQLAKKMRTLKMHQNKNNNSKFLMIREIRILGNSNDNNNNKNNSKMIRTLVKKLQKKEKVYIKLKGKIQVLQTEIDRLKVEKKKEA